MSYSLTNEAGTVRWYSSSHVLHRTDGPALTSVSGARFWYVNGLRHRTDGPAAQYCDGTVSWWLRGVHFRFSDWIELIDASSIEKLRIAIKYSDRIS